MDASQQTLRITGLPPNCEERDVEHFFNERITRHHSRQIIERVGPISSYGSGITKRTTVSFSSHNTAQKALDLQETNRRLTAEKGGAGTITLDHTFLDLTTLHSSVNPETGRPDIDVVALHGLTGHAWNSFTTSNVVDAGRTKEINWLRDILPRLLEQNKQQAIYPRVMTYGYDADVWMTRSVADLDVPVTNLLTYLDTERIEDPGRPLFFIGHSLGGIVIKQAIVALANEAMKTSLQQPQSGNQYNFPVEGCMFFGVPNLGTEYATGAAKILKVLNTVFSVNRNVVQELVNKSQRLANIASEFRQIRSEHKIPVISFFETVNYNYTLGLIVDKGSAVVEYPGSPRPFGINRNHKEMVRFSHDATHALEPAIFHLAQFSRNALALRRPSRPGPYPYIPPPSPGQPGPITGEDGFSILESYDTVFLVDDSPSMSGKRWDLVNQILTYSLALATQYDPNGIDIHFLNNRTANVNNVKDQSIAVEIHRQITLRGSTPIRDQLSRHLNDYLYRFTNQNEMNFKGYNLIVLTDGDPDPDYEDPDDISDREDARVNKPAYRLIRKKIVQIARDLQKVRAERNQVGIQFCQVGDDQAASSFFQYLDNRLKGKYDLDRDMVDTIKCQTEADLTEAFFKKLLLGAINKRLDQEETTAAPSSSWQNYTHHPSQLTHTATVNEDRQQDGGNRRAKTWAMDQRLSESSHQGEQQSQSDPKITTLNHPYNTPNTPFQPPRYFNGRNLHGIPEQQQQQPFPENPPPFPQRPLPENSPPFPQRPFPENSPPFPQRPHTHRLIHPLSMPPDDTREERQPRSRGSLGSGLNKIWRGQ